MRRQGEQGRSSRPEESTYVNLLERFVEDLASGGVRVMFVTVNDQLHEFPLIESSVERLAGKGLLEFHDAAEWTNGEAVEPSPEGHLWGKSAHRVIGQGLAKIIDADRSQEPPRAGIGPAPP